jgi:DNA-binding transcriptional ArsR family regulator
MREVAEKAERTAEIHRVLANPRRLRILWALKHRELSVGELSDAIGASLQCTSQHLRLMRDHGMVGSRREGQTIYYHIEETACKVDLDWLDSHSDSWDPGVSPPSSRDKDKGDLS